MKQKPFYVQSRRFFQSKTSFAPGVATFCAIIGGCYATKTWYKNVLRQEEFKKSAHPDRSQISLEVKKQIEDPVALIKFEDRVHFCTETSFEIHLLKQVEFLEENRRALKERACETFCFEFDELFDPIYARRERFKDWYFGYKTSYKLLSLAAKTSVMEGKDQVAIKLEDYLKLKYQNIILKPELTEPQVQQIFESNVKEVHKEYLKIISQISKNTQIFLAENTTHLEEKNLENVSFQLDWTSQIYKIRSIPSSYEKSPELTLGFILGGSYLGKALGIGVFKTLFSGFLSKLSAPFVAKGILAGGGAVAGSFVGPVGALGGAVAGLGVDYAANKVVKLMKQDEFIQDLEEIIEATQKEWKYTCEQELNRICDIWIDDTIQAVLKQRKLRE